MAKYLKTERDGGILTIRMDDPTSSVNTVSPEWVAEMEEAFGQAASDESVTGIIIASGKPGFMAGADLKWLIDHPMSEAEAFAFSQRASRMHRLIETCGKPTVAAITGFCLGGGYELALACTYRIIADDPGAVVGLPEVKVGLLPGSGGTQRLPRMIGLHKASEILLGGETYAPTAAQELGLVDRAVPAEDVLAVARDWLSSSPDPVRPWDKKGFKTPESIGLLSLSTADWFMREAGKLRARYGGNYPAPINILSCLFEGLQVPIDKALVVESRRFALLAAGKVSRNIIRTTFVNKRLAEQGVRRPQGIPTTKVGRIGVLGAGMMGAGIAYAAAKVGIDVVLLDTELDRATKGKGYSESLVLKQVSRGAISQSIGDGLLARIQPTDTYDDLAGIDLIVEAVFEDAAIKADVIKKAQAVIGESVVFASNTSTLPITQLAETFSRPADFIGLHFFSPVDRMALVEVIMGRETAPATLAKALDFVGQLRKTPIVVNDRRGFYTSRVFQTFIHEGMELLREGVAPALIENVAKQAGMPVGPLAVTDETTIALPLRIVREAVRDEPSFEPPTSTEVMETMVETLERPGRAGGAGFYEYPEDGKKRLWPGLKDHFPIAAVQPSADEVRKRLLYIQALETVRCLEEGVLMHPADGDLGSVFGWSFPSWTGGTLSLIEMVGVPQFVAECERLAERCGRRFRPTDALKDMAAKGVGFDWS